MIDASALREDRADVAVTVHPDGQLATVRVTQSADDTAVPIALTECACSCTHAPICGRQLNAAPLCYPAPSGVSAWPSVTV